MAMTKPFKHKSGIYYFRRGVPKDCRGIVGKREWKVSLDTASRTEAEKLILPHLAETNQIIDDIRSGSYRRYSDDQLEQIAMIWSMDFQVQMEQTAEVADFDQDFTDEVYGPIYSEAGLDESIQRYLDRMDWTKLGPKIEQDWPDYEVLRSHCFDEHYHAHVISRPPVLERLESKRQKVKPGDGPRLLDIFELYLKEAQPRDRTEQEYRKSIGDFCAIHGADIPIRFVTKGMIVEYKNLLLRRPKHIFGEQRKLSLRKLAELEGDHETLSGASINKALSVVSVTLEYAVKNDLIAVNPARGVKVQRGKASKKRLPYSIEDLNLIFSNPIFTARSDEKSWLPLLGLFTGARLEELAQLHTSDVQEHDCTHYLNIAEIEEGQTLKNQNSIRRVPLHPRLIELGFLDYVRSRNTKMVFELRPYRGRYSHAFSKWFGRFVREKIGITDSKKVFHSFRHSFKDAGRDCGLDKAIVDALQGHSDGSVSGGYGSGYSLAALDRAMKQIRYPGLRLKA